MLQKNLIKYYKACYNADNRSSTINNFFSTKIENKIIFEQKEEIITGFLPYAPIDSEIAVDIQKIIKLYEKEKEFIYCSIFIIGKSTNETDKLKKICAPLIVYPAKIVHKNELYFIEIDKTNRRINFSILKELHKDDDIISTLSEELFDAVEGNNIDSTTLFGLSKVLKKYITNIQTNELFTFPTLFSEKAIKNLLKTKKLNKQENFMLIPASGAGIIKKSTNTRGIINELDEISKSSNFSTPLKTIFGFEKISISPDEKIGKVPTILNKAQQNVLKNATKFPFNLIVGPPGTGKTFTIATLAIEQMSKNKSILIACRTDQAVDVIAEKIEVQLGIKKIIVRAGRKQYLRNLKSFMKRILSGYGITSFNLSVKFVEQEINTLETEIDKLEKIFIERVNEEIGWGKFFAENRNNRNLFKNIKKKYINWKNKKSQAHWQIINELENKLNQKNSKTIDLIRMIYFEQIRTTLRNNRNELSTFHKALKSRQGTTQEDLFNKTNFNIILKTFPIWLVKMSDIHRVLPLKTELFDLVIIDEAPQCDIASTIPIIQRAKHAIFTGDPNQLKHVSFLSRTHQKIFQDKFNLSDIPDNLLNYRNNSILDIIGDNAQNQQQVTFLNEHYRSTPAIIRFSNNNFYSNELKIMTSRPDIETNEGIEIINCNGKRNELGFNLKEVTEIMSKIKEIVKNQADMKASTCQTIGIISPFRAQVDFISSQIKTCFTIAELQKHNLSVGTAYSFQGEERDIMFISFCVDNNSHHSAVRHINKKDVFNVTITRARSMQYIYHSLNTSLLDTNSLLRKYLESFQTIISLQKHKENSCKDDFVKEVETELKKLDYKIWVAYSVAGFKIDMIIQNKEKVFGIDLIGFPGEFEEAFSLERYRMLYRAGIKTFALPYTYWVTDKEKCLAELIKYL